MKYFIGKEVEGKYKGIETLFIAGSGDLNKTREYLELYPRITQVYFGAYFQTPIEDWANIIKILDEFTYLIITVEVLSERVVNLPKWIIEDSRIHKVITFKNIIPFELDLNTTIKIENPFALFCYPSYIKNGWNEYTKDIELE